MNQTSQPSKSQGSVKNILLIVLAFTTLLFFVYGYIQKLEADKQTAIAVANLTEAQRQEALAMKNEKMAKEAQVLAAVQRMEAEEALAACQKSKKK